MTFEQIKEGIEHCSAEERLHLAAFLKHLLRENDPSYRVHLTNLHEEFDQGRKFTLNQVKRLHEALKAEGL